MKRIIALVLLGIMMSVTLTGCKKIKWMPDEKPKNVLEELSKDELKKNTFYVKNGTKFYAVYMPDGTFKGKSSKTSDSRVLWGRDDLAMVPTLYKNESIAYCSETDNLESVVLERFKDIGYSIGAYNVSYDDEKGMFALKVGSNLVKNTSVFYALKEAKSTNIQIETLNGELISPLMLNSSGVFSCMEKDGRYKIGYYAGTYYTESVVTADLNYFVSYEIFDIDNISYTRNGYVSITMPDYLKSGYYLINGVGLFKYVAEEKGTDIATLDMNTPTYDSYGNGTNSIETQTYNLSVQEDQTNMCVTLILNRITDSTRIELISPNGIKYNFNEEEGNKYTCYLGTVAAGQWKIIISPYDIVVQEAYLSAIPVMLRTNSAMYEIDFEEGDRASINVKYSIEQKNTDYNKVLCVITAPDGTVLNTSNNSRTKEITCDIPYTQEGKYTVRFYYYSGYVSPVEVTVTSQDGFSVIEPVVEEE